ncbi:beta-galactosidase-1-like protein 2 [Oppia nitens]|uniref:beta-galactosidase-1-like protein 2 n=1 Tax=Oppia nitens TaxID=1686743 RepID=UPI0023DC2A24|nr:beta-galactosidase-1-like protein 2 [Oppia nitens]
MKLYILLSIVSLAIQCYCNDQQTNYQYYTSGGIKTGLKADSPQFTLNGKPITLFSGSLHYFRLPKAYWKDRLLKYRAAGLNAIQFYSPWNLHEELPDKWDFETGFLNLRAFLEAAKEADLFVMYRIGPYMCGEWDLGGYPSWLLRDPNMRLRSNYGPHLDATRKWYLKVLSIIDEFQFTKNGGPIIALQFENEFGGIHNDADREYFQFMRKTIEDSKWRELLFNCDSGMSAADAMKTALPGILETDNFNSDSLKYLDALRKAQPNRPLYVSEFWPGWFDAWGEKHHTMTIQHFEKEVTDIVFVANSSINFYMFFGGTNFGFLNGDTVVTSYDYNAPLSETGNYTDKYWKTKELITKFIKERGLPQLKTPQPPTPALTVGYGKLKIKDHLTLDQVLAKVKPVIVTDRPQHMEMLTVGKNYGQMFGFINYRLTNLKKFKHIKLTGGASDRGVILIDGKQAGIVDNTKDYNQDIDDSYFVNTTAEHVLDIIVENTGRAKIGGGINTARKGLNGDVLIDGKMATNFHTYPLEFKEPFVNELDQLKGSSYDTVQDLKTAPAYYRTELHINGQPSDTFLHLDGWTKGNVFVNGFNIGRYYYVGPQQTLYIPAPYLKAGTNQISVFELHASRDTVELVDKPDLG